MSKSNITSGSPKAQKIQNNMAFFEQVAELSPGLLFVIDLREHKIIYVNLMIKALLGLDADDVYKQGAAIFKTVIHPDDFEHRLDNFEKYCKHTDQQDSELEVRLRTKGGDWQWFEIKSQVFKKEADGSVSQLVGTARNIQEQKLGEEKLQQEEKQTQKAIDKYKELFNSIDQGFCTIRIKYDETDKPIDYQFLEVSPSFENQTGIKDGAGRWMRDIAADQDEFWFEVYGRVAKNRKAERFEYFSTPLGRWWNVYAFPINDPALRHIGVLFNDITQRKQAEKALEIQNKQLVQINTDLDNFIYTASHDLKAPISNIEALLQALLRTLPPESLSLEQPKRITSLMQESVERFKKTITNLTEVIKLQKENSEEAVMVDLSEVIKDVCLDLERIIQSTGAQIDVNVVEGPTIHFTQKNLRSVVYNLLSNAIKYRAPDRVPLVQISYKNGPDFDVLTVSDNGLGLEENRINQLFTMFKRFHSHVEGSGIGLYMIKKMVDNAGGRIEVESQPGTGTTFHVYFKR